MANKASKTSYTSKGERNTVSKKLSNAVRRDRTPLEIEQAKMRAYLKGRKAYFLVPNPNPNETAKPFLKVEGSKLFGDYRTFGKIKAKEGAE